MKSASLTTLITSALLWSAECRLYRYKGVPRIHETTVFRAPTSIDVNLNAIHNTQDVDMERDTPEIKEQVLQIGEELINHFGNGSSPRATTYHTTQEGYRNIAVDTPSSSNLKYFGTITVRNAGGCLSGDEFSKKSLLGFLTVWLIILVVVEYYHLQRHSDIAVKHHLFLFRLSVISALEFMVHYLSVVQTNSNCTDSEFLKFVAMILRTGRDIAFTATMLFLCNGWGIAFSKITKRRWTTFTKLAGFMVVPSLCCGYTVVYTVEMKEFLGLISKMMVINRMGLQFVLCALMVVSLDRLRKRVVNDKQWTYRLMMFKRILLVTHCIAFIYFVHSVWNMMTWDSTWYSNVSWRYQWIHYFGIYDILFVILLTTMVIIWRVSPLKRKQRGYVPIVTGLEKTERGENLRNHVHVMDDMDLEMDSDVEIETLLSSIADMEASGAIPVERNSAKLLDEVESVRDSMRDVDAFWV